MVALIIVIIIIILIAFYIFSQYNSLVKLRNLVKESFSTMDVYLKKRWDLVPNLVETVKGYMKHEESVLENVTKLRASSYDEMSTEDKIDKNSKLSAGLSKLIAVSENYPDLKANENFISLTQELSKIEEDIANSRKYYNGTVRNLNDKVEMFPSNMVAGMFGFKTEKMFEIANSEERENVKVKF